MGGQVNEDVEKGAQQNTEKNEPTDQDARTEPGSEKTDAASAPSRPPAPGLPPDGGLQAWMVVVGAFCGLFVSFGWINCKSPHSAV